MYILNWLLYTSKKSYLFRGNYVAVKHEVTSQVDTNAPKDINGMYMRNGPNADHIPSDNRFHLFDGDGMIHAVHIKDGTAQYFNR